MKWAKGIEIGKRDRIFHLGHEEMVPMQEIFFLAEVMLRNGLLGSRELKH